ncbi:MAG: hypothetical protein ACR2JI_06005 [Mycobacterium sp.]
MATTLVVSASPPQTDRGLVSAVGNPVRLEVALAGAVLDTALSAAPSETASFSPSTATRAAAAAVGSDPLYEIVRTVAIATSYLLEPLWLIGFPITFPIGLLVANVIVPQDGPGSGEIKILTAISLPIALANYFFPPQNAAPTAASRARSSRSPVTPARAAVVPVASIGKRSDQQSPRPAASKRSPKSAAAIRSSDTSKPAGAASTRRTAG